MKIGIITYHSAYNFGSVLQAYATQECVRELGHDVGIINYRLKSQEAFYKPSAQMTPKGIIKMLLDIGKKTSKENRIEKYENFIAQKMDLTSEFSEPEEFYKCFSDFDILISGSDQIWNKYSNELRSVDWKYMEPYLLHGFPGKKISYASSVVTMQEQDLQHICRYLMGFHSIACREENAAASIRKITNKEVVAVCDPTLLLEKERWRSLCDDREVIHGDYVLLYTLGTFKKANHVVNQVSKCFPDKKIVVLAPLASIMKKGNCETLIDVGPAEFLKLIDKAKLVITDSYHGTLFSINFNKNFYYFSDPEKNEIRIVEVLKRLGLMERMISGEGKFEMDKPIEYGAVTKRLRPFREQSRQYLADALR